MPVSAGATARGDGPRRGAVLLMGPTGAGKSDLAVALAGEFPFEIVSVDSALVYRGMDIGTAKPPLQIRHAVPHHLIDIRDPAATYSAGDFVQDAAAAMESIWRRGHQPLFVGGTMLYFHALSHGLAVLPEADLGVRAEIDARAATAGWAELHRELAEVDPVAAARIHNNDPQRIQRALEVYKLTGEPISRLQQARVSVMSDIDVVELAIAPLDRKLLHERLKLRFEAMLAAGFVEEVRVLRKRSDLSAEHPTMRAVGYRQIWQYLAGECGLEEAGDEAIVATRQLAKRQMTWLRRRSRARWFDSTHRDVASSVSHALSEGGITRWF
jgi:tRNA dimethylallyltransferase